MLKKYLSIFIAFACIFASAALLSACGSDAKDGGKAENTAKIEENTENTDPEAQDNGEDTAAKDTVKDETADQETGNVSDEGGNDTSADYTDTETVIPEETPENAIENSYFEFKYYDDWKENVRFETKETEGRYEILCYGVGAIDGFHCFSIIFADCDGMADHYYMGTLDSTPVYTYVNQNFEGLSEDQTTLINETVLSYYMNDLTYQLKEDSGFVTGR